MSILASSAGALTTEDILGSQSQRNDPIKTVLCDDTCLLSNTCLLRRNPDGLPVTSCLGKNLFLRLPRSRCSVLTTFGTVVCRLKNSPRIIAQLRTPIHLRQGTSGEHESFQRDESFPQGGHAMIVAHNLVRTYDAHFLEDSRRQIYAKTC